MSLITMGAAVRATTRALSAIDHYRKRNGPDEDVQTTVVDLLSDILVYAGSWGQGTLDFEFALDTARMHANEELEGWVL